MEFHFGAHSTKMCKFTANIYFTGTVSLFLNTKQKWRTYNLDKTICMDTHNKAFTVQYSCLLSSSVLDCFHQILYHVSDNCIG